MKNSVAICGASGFVGRRLTQHFSELGWVVVPLGRKLLLDGVESRLIEALSGCDVVINVAGATINHRWSDDYKQELYDSRVGVVRRLAEALRSCDRVSTFVSASAVGYYPSSGCYDEGSILSGDDFLARLCKAWEAETRTVPINIRTIITRFGVVFDKSEGAFIQMSRPARLGVATVIGSGRQPFSWIAIDDLCCAISFLVLSDASGVFNLVSPERLSQGEATAEIARYYNSRIKVRVPSEVFRVLWGEAADFLVKGQCVYPTRLLDAGFKFKSGCLSDFLNT